MTRQWLAPRDIQRIFQLKKSTLYSLLNRGQVPGAERTEAGWRIDRCEFSAWVDENMVKEPNYSAYAYEEFLKIPREFWDELPEWLTCEEVNDELLLPRSTFYENLKSGRIPGAIQIGSTWRIHRDTFKNWRSERRLGQPDSSEE